MLYSAALLPNMKQETIKQEMEGLQREIYELDNRDEIEEVEKRAAERLEKMKKKHRPVSTRTKRKPIKIKP